jgi:tRNA threonylcarbamoyladenosine dehydratase
VTEDFSYRFGGIQRLYGPNALEYLHNAHVCVIGIGGVGSWAAEALARSAIGEITLIDLDDICVSNVNRQIHALDCTVGKSKVEVMAERISHIQPSCRVNVIQAFVTEKTLEPHLQRGYDYVIDAIDSVKHKCAIIAYCRRNKIPLITIGGAGGQTDPTLIRYCDLSKSYHDPLLAKARKKLRSEYNFPANPQRRFGIECVFSEEQLVYPQADGSVCAQKPGTEGSMKLDCSSGFGAATYVTATFGFVAVSRVIRKILEKAQRQAAVD